jgi:large subunit ribosomal protein L5
MYEFLDRLINVVIPRIRDFRGLPRRFDGRGNYNLGLDEQLVFPEVSVDKVQFVQGMNITIVVRNTSDDASYQLLRLLGMPFALPGTAVERRLPKKKPSAEAKEKVKEKPKEKPKEKEK